MSDDRFGLFLPSTLLRSDEIGIQMTLASLLKGHDEEKSWLHVEKERKEWFSRPFSSLQGLPDPDSLLSCCNAILVCLCVRYTTPAGRFLFWRERGRELKAKRTLKSVFNAPITSAVTPDNRKWSGHIGIRPTPIKLAFFMPRDPAGAFVATGA